ncbi:MAG: hypothetical protein JXN62_12770 [Bacteroidales bacterium]|nr:hypothetical protein [Bacteroidales bacterium]
MGKRKHKKRSGNDFSPEIVEWILQGLEEGSEPQKAPSLELAEEINAVFVREFKKSPMWKNMITDFGKEKTEEMLKQIRVESEDL